MRKGMILFLALLFVFSCGKDSQESGTEPDRGHGGTTAAGDEPISMIPDDEFTAFETIVNAHIRPYFDEDGTSVEKAVKPDEMFDIYVFAEFNKDFKMAGAEYSLTLPEGVVVLSSVNTDSVIVSLGKHDVDFMITFRCIEGPKHWLVKYVCKATEEFKGGKVATAKGRHQNFLGFTSCDSKPIQVRGRPGTATLVRQ